MFSNHHALYARDLDEQIESNNQSFTYSLDLIY